MWGGGMWPEGEPVSGGGMWPEAEPIGGGMWPEAEPMGGGMWPEGEPIGGGMWPEAEPRDASLCADCVATCMLNFAEKGPEMQPHHSGPPECLHDCYFACTNQPPPLDPATCGCRTFTNPRANPTAPTALTLASCALPQLLRATSPLAL